MFVVKAHPPKIQNPRGGPTGGLLKPPNG